MTLNAVVLPAPFGPMSPKIVCGSTSKLTSSSESRANARLTLRSPPAGVEILAPEVLHRRLARRGDVGGVVRGVVDGADDEVPVVVDVQDVDAAGRLLEVAEEHAIAGQRAAEDR